MKKLILFGLFLFSALSFAAPPNLGILKFLDGVTSTGAGLTGGPARSGEKTFQAVVTGTGSVTATVLVQVSNDPVTQGWLTMGTITLSGTTTATDGFSSDAGWLYYRGNLSAVTGTGATVYLYASEER